MLKTDFEPATRTQPEYLHAVKAAVGQDDPGEAVRLVAQAVRNDVFTPSDVMTAANAMRDSSEAMWKRWKPMWLCLMLAAREAFRHRTTPTY